MGYEELSKLLVALTINLEKICDGYDAYDANKKSNLTLKIKVLFCVSEKGEITPGQLINQLGIAKSNLTVLCKSMLEEGLITSKKSATDKRSISYIITNKGAKQLKNYLNQIQLDNINLFKSVRITKGLEKKITEILKLLNKNND